LTLELIVSAAGVSKSSLMRKFRETLKQTPFEYIKTRRLDEALSLMKQGDHSIGDISLLVGYEDFSAFSRAFRQRFKNSPSKYMGSNK
jgi:AraC-like DNA-binding protein